MRQDRLADADPFLTGVGTASVVTPEMIALKDRANLALGFAYLQKKNPQKARLALERVRLSGPYSNKALLALGWADAQLGDYKSALAYAGLVDGAGNIQLYDGLLRFRAADGSMVQNGIANDAATVKGKICPPCVCPES